MTHRVCDIQCSIVKKAFWSHLIPSSTESKWFFKLSLSKSHFLIYREWAILYNLIKFRSHHFLYCNQQIVSHIYILEINPHLSDNNRLWVTFHIFLQCSLLSHHILPIASEWCCTLPHTYYHILNSLWVMEHIHIIYRNIIASSPMNDRQWEMLCFFWNGHHIWDHHWQGVSVILSKNYLIIILSYQSQSVAFCSLLKGSHHILPSHQ